MSSLYQLTEEWHALDAILDGAEEGSEGDAATVARWVEELDASLERKTEGCIQRIKSLEAMAHAAKTEATRLRSLAQSRERAAEHLTSALQALLVAAGRGRVETGTGTASLAKSPPRVELLCEVEALPEWCRKTTIAPRLDEIKRAIGAGHQVDFAKLTSHTTLRIK